MLKYYVVLFPLVVFIPLAFSQSALFESDDPAPHRPYTELFFGEMLDNLEPLIKSIHDQWIQDYSDAFVRRDAPTTPNVLVSVQKHMDQFKNCIDQTLANTVDEVNVKQVQPVFEVLGEHLNKLSKAFEDLTATKAPYRK
ncbi:uncharacterized protein [Choristoneura fumiferana]|uniref:uncharacterized protein n=1 Tax=Choristoneura fumiferana TaxID=7141 RepID=UPI003D157DD2